MAIITIRAVIFYIILMMLMKLMGKRQIGEMQVNELVTAFLLSELAVLPVTDTEIPPLHGLVPQKPHCPCVFERQSDNALPQRQIYPAEPRKGAYFGGGCGGAGAYKRIRKPERGADGDTRTHR